jgi:hypothetical protein
LSAVGHFVDAVRSRCRLVTVADGTAGGGANISKYSQVAESIVF